MKKNLLGIFTFISLFQLVSCNVNFDNEVLMSEKSHDSKSLASRYLKR